MRGGVAKSRTLKSSVSSLYVSLLYFQNCVPIQTKNREKDERFFEKLSFFSTGVSIIYLKEAITYLIIRKFP